MSHGSSEGTKKGSKYGMSFISGGIAGMASKTTIAPFERIKLLYMTRSIKFTYKSAFTDI